MLPDDVIAGEPGCLKQMVEAYEETGGAMVATMEVAPEATSSYGILDADNTGGNLVKARGMVEKPAAGTAPSNLAVIGRYILTPKVLNNLSKISEGAGGELQLTDAIAKELEEGRDVFGYRFEGERYDCGSKAGFLQATVAFALARPELRDDLSAYLRDVVAPQIAAE
jgi:UTP--glucose-1-phosphate uridylyltransferase